MDVTLDLVLTVSNSKECPRTFSAVRCPHCHSEQIVTRGKTRRGTQRSFYPAHGDAYTRHLASEVPRPGKTAHADNQAPASDRADTPETLVRKTISCSETRQLHDIVMGLLVHCSAFGRTVSQ